MHGTFIAQKTFKQFDIYDNQNDDCDVPHVALAHTANCNLPSCSICAAMSATEEVTEDKGAGWL